MPADIHAFFESYRDAFNRLDGRTVSAHYDQPAMIVHVDGSGVFADRDALDKNNVALCAQYEKDGFVRADFTERACMPLGDQFCLVDLAWTIARKDRAPQEFNTAYSLAKRHGHWKVAMVTAYQERRPGEHT